MELYFLIIFSAFQITTSSKPNFVILIADDLGYGDLGCFGNNTIKSSNIDKIALEGAKLKHDLATASVCTPSRAALLTGRYAVRMGMESNLMNRVFLVVAQKGGLPTNETTYAELLKENGYNTALIGKWHLGNDGEKLGDMIHHPLNHGFDHFYGMPITNFKDFAGDGSSVVTTFYPNFYTYITSVIVIGLTLTFSLCNNGYRKISLLFVLVLVLVPGFIILFVKNIHTLNGIVMRNADVIEQPVVLPGLTQRFVKEAKTFLAEQHKNQKPFLLLMPFVHVHTALFTAPEFAQKSLHGRYGDNVEEMDWAVGEIMKELDKYNFKDNTFVYFTSDNGAHKEETGANGEHEGGYNGVLKGGKGMGGIEGGIRVPTVVRWPREIPPNQEIVVPTSHLDLFTTILAAANVKLPTDRIIDGKNLIPLLSKKTQSSPHRFLFHYCGTDIHAARYIPEDSENVWKVYYKTPNFINNTDRCPYICHCFGKNVISHYPPLLYNIATDISEKFPLDINSNSKYLKIMNVINQEVEKHKYTVQSVPHQFSFKNAMWNPLLQPCCNFPFCSCNENSDTI